jgi:hypothetical protein
VAKFEESKLVDCLLCGGKAAGRFAGKKHNIVRHVQRWHPDVLEKPKSSPITEALGRQAALAERGSITEREAHAELGALAACKLYRLCLSGNAVNEIRAMPEVLLKALRRSPAKSTMLGEGGHADEQVSKLTDYLRDLLRAKDVVLAIDGSTTRYAGGGKITLVSAESAELDHPVLLSVYIEVDGACDAEYYCTCLQETIKMYELTTSQIVGVVTDNAAVMPKSVKLAGFQHLPCSAHLLNLMLKAFADALDFSNLFGWRLFVDDAARRTAMARAGLEPAVFNSA